MTELTSPVSRQILLTFLIVTSTQTLTSCDSDSPAAFDIAVDSGDVGDVSDPDVPDLADTDDEDSWVDARDTTDAQDDAELPPDPNRVSPRFDPGGEGFYRMPWPSDYRRS